MTIWDIVNIPTIVSTYAPKASPVFTGTVTAPTFIGALTGNASTATALAANPTDCSSGQFANAIAANGNLTCSQVTLTTGVIGVLPLANGGTNKNMTASAGSVVYTDADSLELTAVGSSGQILSSNGSSAPSFTTAVFPSTATSPSVMVANASNTFSALSGSTANRLLKTSGSAISFSQADLTTDVTGALPIANGGTNNASLAVTAGGVVYTDGSKLVNTGVGTSGQYLKSNAGSAPAFASFTPMTVQRFTSGTAQTYNLPAGVLYIKVKMMGGGGGGSGSGTSAGNGGAGTASTFGASLTAGAGSSGNFTDPAGGAGGTNTISTGTTIMNVDGGRGDGYVSMGTNSQGGKNGGVSFFGGTAGAPGTDTAGQTVAANSGSGGSGGGTNSAAAQTGTGGGAGGYIEVLITSPSSTYTYTVGPGGAGGSAGTNGRGGSAGASGIIIVEEYYQ